MQLNDASSEAHVARGNALSLSLKWSEAETEFRRAIELNTNNANAHYFYAFNYLMPMNKLDESQEEFRLALAPDPIRPDLGWLLDAIDPPASDPDK